MPTLNRTKSLFRNRYLRVGLFIDESNMFASARYRFGRLPDYVAIRNLAVDGNTFVRAILYTADHGETESRRSRSLPTVGIETKSMTVKIVGGREKCNWDVGICMDVVTILDTIDIVVLTSGDGDFAPLIEYCRSRGKIVRTMSFLGSTASEIKTMPNEYIQLELSETLDPTTPLANPEGFDAFHPDIGAVSTAAPAVEESGTEAIICAVCGRAIDGLGYCSPDDGVTRVHARCWGSYQANLGTPISEDVDQESNY